MRLRLALLGSFAVLGVAAPAAQAVEVWSPAAFNYGSKSVNSTTKQDFVLTALCDANTGFPAFFCTVPGGGVHPVGVPTITGDDFSMSAPDNGCVAGVLVNPTGLIPAVCGVVVSFTPNSPGPKTGSLNLPSGPDVALSGTGLPLPAVTPPAKKCKKKGKKKKCKKKK